MARKVVWAYAAEEDLDAAATYIHSAGKRDAGKKVRKSPVNLKIGQ